MHALYHNNRVIPRVLACAYALEIAGIAVGLALALPGITYDNVCVATGVPGSLIIYGQVHSFTWRATNRNNLISRAAAVAFQFLLFGLTLYKFIQALRSGWGDVPLIILLVRDGTWAFFLLFCRYRLASYSCFVDPFAFQSYMLANSAYMVCITTLSQECFIGSVSAHLAYGYLLIFYDDLKAGY